MDVAVRNAGRGGGQCEVAETGISRVVVEDAVRRQPSVSEVRLAGGQEGTTDPVDQPGRLVDRKRTAGQAVGQRSAVEPAHDQVRGTGLPPVVVDGDDRRVVERGDATGGRLEAAHELRTVGHGFVHDPDGEVAVDARQAGGEDRAVSARAQPLAQHVPPQPLAGRLDHEQRRVLGEEAALEVDQGGCRVEPELVAEIPAQVLERAQGVGLAARPVEGDHQLRPEGPRAWGWHRPGPRSRGSGWPPGRARARLRTAARRRQGATRPVAGPLGGPSPRRRTRRTRPPATGRARSAARPPLRRGHLQRHGPRLRPRRSRSGPRRRPRRRPSSGSPAPA